MAMSKYNRENPFMYLLEQKEMELTNKTSDLIQAFIRQCILVSLLILAMLIYMIRSQSIILLLEIALNIVFTVLLYLNILNIGRAIKAKEVNDMIFGDNFRDINLNNEILLSKINKYNINIGKAVNAYEITMIYRVICMINLAFYCILILYTFFV